MGRHKAVLPNSETVMEIKVAKVFFIKDIPIFLNWRNSVSVEEFDLRISNGMLIIYNSITDKSVLVPLCQVAVIESVDDQS